MQENLCALLQQRRTETGVTLQAIALSIGRTTPSSGRDVLIGRVPLTLTEWARVLVLVDADPDAALRAARADGMLMAGALPVAMQELQCADATTGDAATPAP